jgi:Cu/Ag efflux protein CusF
MMHKNTLALAVAALLLPGIALAQQQPSATAGAVVAREPGKAVAAAAEVEVTANITAVDKATRTVTLKGPSGNTMNYVAGPEVKNFDQIKAGDQVVLRLGEAISFELAKTTSPVRERIEREGMGRAKPGDRPAGSFVREVQVVADVVAVDAKKQTVTLRGPQRTVTLKVQDPAKLAAVKVGDQVDVSYVETASIVVFAGGAKK